MRIAVQIGATTVKSFASDIVVISRADGEIFEFKVSDLIRKRQKEIKIKIKELLSKEPVWSKNK